MGRSGAILNILAVLLACAPAPASAAQSSQAGIRGVVRDATDAVLPDAEITLTSLETSHVRRTRSAQDGTFLLVGLSPGKYRVRCVREGFAPAERDLELTLDLDLMLTIALELARQTEQSIEVVASDTPMIESSKTSLGRTITTNEIDSLPLPTSGSRGVMVLAILTPGIVPVPNFTVFNISTAGQSAASNTVLVDGMSMDAMGLSVGPPFDAIKEVKAVSNHFSAEFGQASGAVLNTVTRSGSNRANGRLTYLVQNGAWNATSAIARRVGTDDPGRTQHTVGGFWAGPGVRDRLFLFGAAEYTTWNAVHINTSPVLAQFRPGESATIPVRVRIPKIFARSDMNATPGNVFTATYNDQLITNSNAAREDLSAEERGRRLGNTGHDLTATDRQIVGASAVLEVRGKWSRDRFNQDADEHCPGCVTLNYTNALLLGKPAETPVLRITDRGVLAGVFTWLVADRGGSHTLKTGLDANVVRVVHDQALNVIGTYTFRTPIPFDPAVRASYPSMFTQNFGDPRTTLAQTTLSTFVQDDWRPREGLFVNLGVRWDHSRWPAPSSRQNDVAPRVGVAFDPSRRGTTVFRAAAGRYYDELGLAIARDAETHFVTRTIRNPGYQGDMRLFDPAGFNPNGPALATLSTTFGYATASTQYTDQASVGFQQQIGRQLAFNADLVRALGHRLPVGRDLNYPDPITHARPDPSLLQQVVTETTAHSWYTGLQVGLYKRAANHHAYSVAYTWSSAESDTNGSRQFPMDQHNILADRGPLPTSARHRVSASGTIDLPFRVRLAAVVTARGGLPYNVTTGSDDNGDGVINDRPPGRGRNDALGAAFFQADVRLSKTIAWGPRRLELLIEAFNVTNRENWIEYRGNTARPETFATPGDSGPSRQVQLGVRWSW